MNIFEFGMEDIELSLWAATLILLPWSLLRRKHDLFCGILLAFFMLGIGVMARIHTMGNVCICVP
jgi:hypothetical protein